MYGYYLLKEFERNLQEFNLTFRLRSDNYDEFRHCCTNRVMKLFDVAFQSISWARLVVDDHSDTQLSIGYDWIIVCWENEAANKQKRNSNCLFISTVIFDIINIESMQVLLFLALTCQRNTGVAQKTSWSHILVMYDRKKRQFCNLFLFSFILYWSVVQLINLQINNKWSLSYIFIHLWLSRLLFLNAQKLDSHFPHVFAGKQQLFYLPLFLNSLHLHLLSVNVIDSIY